MCCESNAMWVRSHKRSNWGKMAERTGDSLPWRKTRGGEEQRVERKEKKKMLGEKGIKKINPEQEREIDGEKVARAKSGRMGKADKSCRARKSYGNRTPEGRAHTCSPLLFSSLSFTPYSSTTEWTRGKGKKSTARDLRELECPVVSDS